MLQITGCKGIIPLMKKKWNPSVRGSGGPKYLAVVEALEAAIANGELSAGDKLPSQRELCNMFGVTIATVTKAINEATHRGMVEARIGSGTFIREPEAQQRKPESIDLSINILPPTTVADILNEAVAQLSSDRLALELFSYASYAGSAQHRQLGAQWISQFGTRVDPENLLLTNGVHQGLLAAFGALLAPGATAVCEPLTYTGVRRIADFRGVQLVGAECDEYGLIPESVERELRRSGAKVLVVTTVMQNPTTATLSAERRLALADICRRNEAWIIEDGVNIPLANDGIPAIADVAPERTIHLTGFSKCIASGFRLGYAVLPENLHGPFHEALIGTQWIAPGFYEALAAAMLGNGMIEQCLVRHRSEASARMALVQRFLPGVTKTQLASYHAWVAAPAGWSSEDFSAQALQMGVRISPASHFAISRTGFPAAYRISLGACPTRAILEEGLKKLAAIGGARPLAYETVI
jgi:DNA-binding transcriptional MocR family regulator